MLTGAIALLILSQTASTPSPNRGYEDLDLCRAMQTFASVNTKLYSTDCATRRFQVRETEQSMAKSEVSAGWFITMQKTVNELCQVRFFRTAASRGWKVTYTVTFSDGAKEMFRMRC